MEGVKRFPKSSDVKNLLKEMKSVEGSSKSVDLKNLISKIRDIFINYDFFEKVMKSELHKIYELLQEIVILYCRREYKEEDEDEYEEFVKENLKSKYLIEEVKDKIFNLLEDLGIEEQNYFSYHKTLFETNLSLNRIKKLIEKRYDIGKIHLKV